MMGEDVGLLASSKNKRMNDNIQERKMYKKLGIIHSSAYSYAIFVQTLTIVDYRDSVLCSVFMKRKNIK